MKHWRDADRMDRRAVWIGIIGAILLHLFLILSAPYIQQRLDPGDTFVAIDKDKPFDVELVPPEDDIETMPKFVEANPNVPDNVPDETDQVAAQNQQVAQETPTPDGESEAPASKGDPDKQGTALVSGDLTPQLPPSPPSPPTPDQPQQQQPPQESMPPLAATTPPPGEEEIKGEDEDGIGSNVVRIPEQEMKPGEERVEGEPDATRTDGPQSFSYYQVDAQNPQPRQFLPPTSRGRPSPIFNNEYGTRNIGPTGYDAKWSSYGEYMQKLVETVQMQWERILSQGRVYPPSGSIVKVVFKINSEGEISGISSVSGSGNKFAEDTCVSAIVDRAPYEKWTTDMVRILGEEQELTFTFYFY